MFERLIPQLLIHDRIAVFSHLSPDGDCLGAQIALCLWLKRNGVEAVAYNEDTIPENLQWLLEFYPVSKPTQEEVAESDAYIFVDGNAPFRFGQTAESLPETGRPLFMIDHHPQPSDVFTDMVSDVTASSTCELIFRLYSEHEITQIDEAAGKAMYTGLVTDTGSFQFDSVSPNTLKAAAELLDRGDFKPNHVIEKIYSNRKLKQLNLLGMALETITVMDNQQIASMYVTLDMMQKTQTTKEDTEGFVQYPLSIEGVKSCVFFREEADRIKLSLRSRSDEIDVNEWARNFNGGGHKRAAGAFVNSDLKSAMEQVLSFGAGIVKPK